MEVNGCKNLLNYLLSQGMAIRVFASDRSISIRSLMAKSFPWIKHNFDVWYVELNNVEIVQFNELLENVSKPFSALYEISLAGRLFESLTWFSFEHFVQK